MVNFENQVEYVLKTFKMRNVLYYKMAFTRITLLFQGMNTLRLLKDKNFDSMRNDALSFIKQCYNSNGGFSSDPTHSPTLFSTLAALKTLYILKSDIYSTNVLDTKKTLSFIVGLQTNEGGFQNDLFGDVDTRIDCCAIISMKLLELLNNNDFSRESLEVPLSQKTLNSFACNNFLYHILSCQNPDGGFGQRKGSESHVAQAYCCVMALKWINQLDTIDLDALGIFVSVHQDPQTGGMSGRINKKPDVCYAFYALGILKIIEQKYNKIWIDYDMLKKFILSCEDDDGGFSYRPGNDPDLYHQLYAIAALALMNYDGFETISVCIL